jgi:hypothetical protein
MTSKMARGSLFLVFLLFIDALRNHTDCRVVAPQEGANLLGGVLMDANRSVELLIPRLLVRYISEQLGQARTSREAFLARDLLQGSLVGKRGVSFSYQPRAS